MTLQLPKSLILQLLIDSPNFREWAVDNLKGKSLIENPLEDLRKIMAEYRPVGNKIGAIKKLRDYCSNKERVDYFNEVYPMRLIYNTDSNSMELGSAKDLIFYLWDRPI